MDELDAVNIALDMIGEEPVNNLVFTGVTDASTAYRSLINVCREVQEPGLTFNKEYDYPLMPNPEGFIMLPENTLFVDPMDSRRLIQRGQRLYDATNHTYTFDKKVLVEIILFLPFEELPSYARSYIAIRAGRRFQRGILGSGDLDGITSPDETQARMTFRSREISAGDHNYLDAMGPAKALRRRP